MTLIVGAPVADRAWALPRWLDCIAGQSVQPDLLLFVHSDTGDSTREILEAEDRWPVVVIDAPEPFIRRELRLKDRVHTYGLLADLRNRLLRAALDHDASLLFSLDTDIFLTDPTVIGQLVAYAGPVAQPLVYLSPHGAGMDPPVTNAAFWTTDDRFSPRRQWRRPDRDEIASAPHGVLDIDIPMAAVMMRRPVLEHCRYRYHEAGEDLGFAHDLDSRGYRTRFLTWLECPHVMSPDAIDRVLGAAAV